MKYSILKNYCAGVLIAGLGLWTCLPSSFAQTNDKEATPRKIARLVWQDDATLTLRWADLERSLSDWSLKAHGIPNAPSLDIDRQKFSQMQRLGNSLIVGVRDDDEGQFSSGWIAVDSGVTLEEHGDHHHAHYNQAPSIAASRLDTQQGNPAHVYRIGKRVFIANDSKQGFTILAASPPDANSPLVTKFYPAGGSHITLAAVADRYCFATWPDREGENAGRIDMVSILPDPTSSALPNQLASFKAHSGGLHGATSNSNRVFFAPSDGIDWVDAGRLNASLPPKVEHIDLGKDPGSGKPFRTGAFENLSNYVLFTYGTGVNSKLGLIDASSKDLCLDSLSIDPTEGLALATPVAFRAGNDKVYAWIVHHRRGSENQEVLTSVELDPNADGRFDDARIHKQLNIGASKIANHSGMHDIALLPDRRTACISMPGDGSIWIISIYSMEVLAKLNVGGTPTKLESFGGVAH
jgi:hypothetical protein